MTDVRLPTKRLRSDKSLIQWTANPSTLKLVRNINRMKSNRASEMNNEVMFGIEAFCIPAGAFALNIYMRRLLKLPVSAGADWALVLMTVDTLLLVKLEESAHYIHNPSFAHVPASFLFVGECLNFCVRGGLLSSSLIDAL
jgi:hypothetical protein